MENVFEEVVTTEYEGTGSTFQVTRVNTKNLLLFGLATALLRKATTWSEDRVVKRPQHSQSILERKARHICLV